MSKKREIVKSIALTVLVAMSIVLFANSWVKEWSHSDRENDSALRRFFAWAGIESWFGFSGETLPGTDIIAPSSVIFTSGAKRIIVNKGTDMYSSTYEDILSLLSYAEDADSAAREIDSEEWYYAQKNRSVYLDYAVALKKEVLEAGIGCSLPEGPDTVDSVVLASNDSATNKLVIYFHDPETEKFYKLLTNRSAKGVEQILSGFRGYKNIPLAVELGFNATPEEGYGQQLVIYGNNVIDLEGSKEKVPQYRRVTNSPSLLDNRQLSSLLSLFGMSESSAKQYADVDNTYMYIDANATLRFFDSENGAVLEYTAASNQKGVSPADSDSTGDILYNMACGAYSQVYSVKELFSIEGVTLRIASDITGAYPDENQSINVFIDYCYNGIPIYFENEGKAVHAAQLGFNSSGNLIYYKQILFDIDVSQTEMEYTPVMNAIDKIYTQWSSPEKTMFIRNISKSYCVKGDLVNPMWAIKLAEDENVYVIN